MMTQENPKESYLFLENRQFNAEVAGRAHALEAEKLEGRHRKLGVPSVILSTIVGTTAFASLAKLGDTQNWIAIGTGILSVAAAVLTGLQTFYGYADKAKRHSEAATKLLIIARKWDRLTTFGTTSFKQKIEELEREMDQIVREAPRVSIRAQQDANNEVRNERSKASDGLVHTVIQNTTDDRNQFYA